MTDSTDQHAQQLLHEAAQASNRATEQFHDWVKQMLSLAFAALTALVALQKNYTPGSDLARYFLWGTFLSLASSVVCTAIVLRGAGLATRALSRILASDADKPPQNRNKIPHVGSPPRLAKVAKEILPWVLVASVVCLSSFAVVNSM